MINKARECKLYYAYALYVYFKCHILCLYYIIIIVVLLYSIYSIFLFRIISFTFVTLYCLVTSSQWLFMLIIQMGLF